MEKYNKNPILTNQDVQFRVNSIFNAGAVKFNNKYLLLARVEMPNGRSSFVTAISENGFDFKVDAKPSLTPEDHKNHYQFVKWGIEDPRITELNGTYYILYTGYSQLMPLIMLAKTNDFKEFDIIGPISEPTNKDAVLFPEKIDGLYIKIDRPTADNRNDIWLNHSPDLIHWGNHHLVLQPTQGTWEQDKIGISTPPLKTKKGWLIMYHGVRTFGASTMYKQGLLLLSLDQPWKVIGKTEEPFIYPEAPHERTGDVPNVIFSNGWIREPDGEVKIYFSGADTNICVAKTTVTHLLSLCNPTNIL